MFWSCFLALNVQGWSFLCWYLMRVYIGLGVIEFVLLSQCIIVCGCMSSCLGLGLGEMFWSCFLALSVQGKNSL